MVLRGVLAHVEMLERLKYNKWSCLSDSVIAEHGFDTISFIAEYIFIRKTYLALPQVNKLSYFKGEDAKQK